VHVNSSAKRVMFSLCLLASRIVQKRKSSIRQNVIVVNQFSQTSVERWHTGHGRTDWISEVIRITLR